MKTFRYCFKARRNGLLEEYSKTYENSIEAWEWYFNHGTWLEKRCGRELVFKKVNY